jgi:hypothetical protein
MFLAGDTAPKNLCWDVQQRVMGPTRCERPRRTPVRKDHAMKIHDHDVRGSGRPPGGPHLIALAGSRQGLSCAGRRPARRNPAGIDAGLDQTPSSTLDSAIPARRKSRSPTGNDPNARHHPELRAHIKVNDATKTLPPVLDVGFARTVLLDRNLCGGTMRTEDEMNERFAPLQIQRLAHVPHSVDKTMRLRRLEYQLEVLADAVRILAHNPNDPLDRTLADTIQKMLDDCEL